MGRQAPEFKTRDDQGIEYSKSGLLGSKYLLYFYPRDHTPGCTIQACGFRDLIKEFRKEKGHYSWDLRRRPSFSSEIPQQIRTSIPSASRSRFQDRQVFRSLWGKEIYGKSL